MDRIEFESIWLFGPCFADGFVGCEAFEGLQSACEIVGGGEVRQVGAQLLVGLVVEAFDGCLFDRAVHALDLALVQGCRGLVRRWSMSFWAQAYSNACAQNGSPFSI